jgi:hypothetical protein
MKNRNVLFLIFILIINIRVFSQELKGDEYIIVTFEFDRSDDMHSSNNYYWIIPLNVIESNKIINLYPLYFDEYSNNDLINCKENKEINIFTIEKGENFILEKTTEYDIQKLKKIILKKRKKVQVFIKKWLIDNITEKINVYITPVKGSFCSSNIANYSGKDVNYQGIIYLPLSDFKYNEGFFKSDKQIFIEKIDYLKINFKNKL